MQSNVGGIPERMSMLSEKNNVAIILAMVITISGYFIGNTDDAITQDAIDAIREDITDVKHDIDKIEDSMSDHKNIGAHTGQREISIRLDNDIKRLDDEVIRLWTVLGRFMTSTP